MDLRLRAAFLAAVFSSLAAGSAHAVTLGQTDTFTGGVTAGWTSGNPHPFPPVGVTSGGPTGDGDGWLRLTATGLQGAGGKLVAFSGPQWAGDYLAASVTGITMDLSNLGTTALSMRLYFRSFAGTAYTLNPVALSAGSGWTHVSFDITPTSMSSGAATILANVGEFWLYHSPAATFPGPNIASVLGVDNVTAVPEPAALALFVAGLAALGMVRRRQAGAAGRRASSSPHVAS